MVPTVPNPKAASHGLDLAGVLIGGALSVVTAWQQLRHDSEQRRADRTYADTRAAYTDFIEHFLNRLIECSPLG
jgi:hypothetical protein